MVLTSSEIKIMASKAMNRLNKAYEEKHIAKPHYMQVYLRKRAFSEARKSAQAEAKRKASSTWAISSTPLLTTPDDEERSDNDGNEDEPVSNDYEDSQLTSQIKEYEDSIPKLAANAGVRMDYARIGSDLEMNAPKSTLAKYLPIQRKFAEWCYRNKFFDGATVTAEKLVVYLHKEVTYTNVIATNSCN